MRNSLFLCGTACIVALTISFLYPISAASNATNSQLNSVIQDVHNAESSGASAQEMHMMVDRLNTILNLQSQIDNLSNQDAVTKAQLLGQISTGLNSIDAEAKTISTVAAQRTLTAHVVTYTSALVGALFATILYHYCVLFWRKARTRRTFRMTLAPK